MGLVEAVTGKGLHQVEDAIGEAFVDAALAGAGHENAALARHFLGFFLAHGAAQQVGAAEGVAGQRLGDLHDLLLIQDDAVGGVQDRLEVGVQVTHRGLAVFAVDVVADHARFQRSGPEQRDQRDDVLERVRLQLADQVLHAARLELEHRGGVAGAQQLEGVRVVERYGLDVQRRFALTLAAAVDALYGPVDQCQRAQAEEVELDQADGLDVVLVEMGDQAAATGLAIQRRVLRQRPRRDDHAAGVLAGVAGDALQRHGAVENGADLFLFAVTGRQLGLFLEGALQGDVQRAGDQLGDAVDETVAVAQHPAHVADHRTRVHLAEGDDLADPVAAVLPGDVVDHPVALVHAEVDVEVGHGYPLGIQKALEQQVVAQRVEVGDAQRPGYQRAGARAAPRAHRDTAVARPAHEIGHHQEIAGEAHAVDDLEFMQQSLPVILRRRVRRQAVAVQFLLQVALGHRLQVVFCALVLRNGKGRQRVLAEVELKVTAFGDLDAVLQRRRHVREQPLHLRATAQVLLFRVVARAPGVFQEAALVDAHAHLVGIEILEVQEPRCVGGHHGAVGLRGQRQQRLLVIGFALTPDAAQLQVEAVREQRHPAAQRPCGALGLRGQQQPPDIAIHAARQRQ